MAITFYTNYEPMWFVYDEKVKTFQVSIDEPLSMVGYVSSKNKSKSVSCICVEHYIVNLP